MKMIDVLNMVAKGEIKDKTILDVYDHTGDIYTYTFDEKFKAFYDECDEEMANDFEISNKFLNYEVELIPPKEKKYKLKLYIGDITSYVTRSYYDNDFNYDLGSKYEVGKFKKKFTQEEIDNDKFLKFIEKHGIKEEVEE